MRATVCTLLAVLAFAGCGGADDPELPRSGPVASPAPLSSDDLKFAMLTAQRELETYFFAEGIYTADEDRLGPAFPSTVAVEEAGARSFSLTAQDAQGIRYVLTKDGDVVERSCRPPDPDACPGGGW